MQVHQRGTFANFLNEAEITKHTEPIFLKPGWTYEIDVIPHGVRSTENMKNLPIEDRNCLLEDEVPEGSIFKKYSQANCKYECRVALASQNCGCTPWDFMKVSGSREECDVFGRTCFFNEMKMLTEDPDDLCPHCKKSCDYNIFKITKSYAEGGTYYISNNLDWNKTFLDSGMSNLVTTIHGTPPNIDDLAKRAAIVTLNFYPPEIDIVDVQYTFWDKFATVGGNYGIFAEITGISFLGVLNFTLLIAKLISTKVSTMFKKNKPKPKK